VPTYQARTQVLRRRKRQTDISHHPESKVRISHVEHPKETKNTKNTTYDPHPHPRLSQINKQRILRPALSSLNLFERQIDPILLEMDLND
jgi:hypothetical protein